MAKAKTLFAAGEKHRTVATWMAKEDKTNVAKMRPRHAASVSVMMTSLAVSAKTHQVTESDMNATLAFSKDEPQAHDAARQARRSR